MGCWRHKEEPRGIIRNIVDTVKQQICVIKKKQKQICVINYNKIIMEYKVIGQEWKKYCLIPLPLFLLNQKQAQGLLL